MTGFHRLGFILTLWAALFCVTPALAQPVSAPLHSDIEKIIFPGGYLQPIPNEPGVWGEFKSNGEQNYIFRMTEPEAKGFDLVGPSGDVILRINLRSKVISGAWPDHPMAVIHQIRKIERNSPLASASPPSVTPEPRPASSRPSTLVGSPPLRPTPDQPAPGETPSITIVEARPPAGAPQGSEDGTVTPETLTTARYEGGTFEKREGTDWVELTNDGRTFTFEQAAIDEIRLYLYNHRRDILVILEPGSKRTFVAIGGGPLRETNALLSVSDGAISTSTETQSSEPEPPQIEPPVTQPPQTQPPQTQNPVSQPPDDRLSPSDRAVCLRGGGIIERAGLLGAERCTRRYNDGGNICTDSSQCSGQCRAERLTEFGRPAQGVCQPTDNPFGCFTEVRNGVAEPTICVD